MKIFGITGWKNSGKTGLMERLVAEFRTRSFSVSTIKRTHHAVDLDTPGTDSFRHREAGAQETLLASSARVVLMQELRDTPEPGLDDLIGRLSAVDLVLVEGFKSADHPKIEAHRHETGQSLLAHDNATILAVASNTELDLDKPVLNLNDTSKIADFIQSQLDLKK
ncbi:MAG: molybdopterin-guanine dinucleotide biosynthesis protein B [Paracoccaceae bacterium]